LDTFRPGQRLFEIGCGTGTDALWLADQGFQIVATDVSGRMLKEVTRKASVAHRSGSIECRKLAAHEIGTLAAEFGEASFDGGYCHAGALNMEPDLVRVPGGIRSLLRPGGRFVFSVINKTSLFEVLFYPAIFRPRKAFRRLGNAVPIPLSRRPPLNRYVVQARFYSPSEIRSLFRDGFSLERVQGLQVLVPPSNLTEMYSLLAPIFAPLDALDSRLSKHWPFNTWGHHTIMALRRV
jgi:SAM-dependent methyltransferase